jgi:hypothetical protein
MFSKIHKIFTSSLKLINKNPLIYAISLLISFEVIITNYLNLPSFLSIIISVILIGWIGAEIDLINQIYKKKTIKWNQLGNLIFKYLKKLLPFFVVSIIAVTILSLIFTLTYFFGPMINEASSLEERKLLVSNKIFNLHQSSLSTNFSLTKLVFSFITSLIGLIFVQGVVKMVIEDKGIFRSLREAFTHMFKDIRFFLLISFSLALVNQVLMMMFGLPISLNIGTIFYKTIWTYAVLISTTMILINYSNKLLK